MLTAACLLWGEWGEFYVHALKRALERYLNAHHRFVCLSDREIEGVECLPLFYRGWKRNLPKMALYAPENGLTGRVIAFDLDDIPVGPLDTLANYRGRFCCIEDPWDEGKAGGGTVSFEAGDPLLTGRLFTPLTVNPEIEPSGSERYWIRRQLPEADFWPSELVADAKPRGFSTLVDTVPDGAVLMHCHGKPRPHEVRGIPWVDRHFQ